MKTTTHAIYALFVLVLAACGRSDSPSVPASVPGEEEALLQSRVHATFVSFTKWHDTMQIDAGVVRDGDACMVLDPLVADATTKWAPFQIYWAIRDDAANVTLGAELRDAFFPGDVSRASEFPGVLGFAAIGSQYAHLLALESIVVTPDRSQVEAKIGSPFNAKLRLKATPDGAGCAVGTTYCKTSGDCAADSSYRPLSSILVKQNFLGYPTEVVYN